MLRLSDLFDSSSLLFLKLTCSDTELLTTTLELVAPDFFAKSKQKEAFCSKYSWSLTIYNFVPPTVILSISIEGWATPTGTP